MLLPACELATLERAARLRTKLASAAAVPLSAPMQELIQDTWVLDKLPMVEVMELGLPCSGASVAGKSNLGLAKMEDHPHVGHMVHAALVLIARLQPAALIR